MFIRCRTKADVNELLKVAKECDICKMNFGTFAHLQANNSVLSAVGLSTKEETFHGEHAVLENPVKFACWHIFGKNCPRSIIQEAINGSGWPTCPICEAALDGICDLKVPF